MTAAEIRLADVPTIPAKTAGVTRVRLDDLIDAPADHALDKQTPTQPEPFKLGVRRVFAGYSRAPWGKTGQGVRH